MIGIRFPDVDPGLKWKIGLFIIVCVALGAYAASHSGLFEPRYPELAEISAHQDWTFAEFDSYFRDLAQTKGGLYAYDVLLRAELPPGTDSHLLGHTIGYVLYDQKGMDAMRYCTQDFRNACSHSVVISILNQYGEGALDTIARECRTAPGGTGAYTMCFHGLGHGVLAYTDYDLGKAVAMCKKTGTAAFEYREYGECVGGTIMEIIDGVHDPEARFKAAQTYLSPSDPLSPCDTPLIPQVAKSECYAYLTPHLFEAAGTDLANPSPTVFEKAFSFCGALPADDRADRQACYGGFGKEFIGITQSHDIRDVGSLDAAPLNQIRAWCALADDADGEDDCVLSALASLFWGGENKPDAAFMFCALAGAESDACYTELSREIGYYLGDTVKGSALCYRLPEHYRSGCSANPL